MRIIPAGLISALPRSAVTAAEAQSQSTYPVMGVSHLGFEPAAQKRVVVPVSVAGISQQALLSSSGSVLRTLQARSSNYNFGPAVIFDFSDLTAQGNYEITVEPDQASAGSALAVRRAASPDIQRFPNRAPHHTLRVADSVWKTLLPKLVEYHTYQRCGCAVPGVHAVCHLDDGRRRDTGLHVDTTGGWHDAGDFRKWTDSTMMNLFGLLAIVRNLGSGWSGASSPVAPLLDEARWGNLFFLKMQDTDGTVWADVAGGVGGDNSDNHWTDNIAGTADDRWINVSKVPGIQAMFVAAQAMMYQAFLQTDPAYAAACWNAAQRCWIANTHSGDNTTDVAWWTLAAIEMHRANPQPQFYDEIVRLANQLVSLQNGEPSGGQTAVRGFFPMWPGNPEPLRDQVHPAMPAYALLRAAQELPADSAAPTWLSATQLYIDEYLTPLTSLSAYGIVPFGLFVRSSSSNYYRPLGGFYSYRVFMENITGDDWTGLSSHLFSHALLLAEAARYFGNSTYRNMAYTQLEWAFGNNPFGATIATGVGYRNPQPYSPFVGPIPGGVMNGIGGSSADQPALASEDPTCWQTNEYWSPNNGYCEWAISVLVS